MWGEIEPQIPKPIQVQPSLREEEHRPPEEPEAPALSLRYVSERPSTTQKPQQEAQSLSHSELVCVSEMVEVIAKCGSPVKSQQLGEAELTLEERREELLNQYRSRPLVFLERYHAWIKPHCLPAFTHVCSDPRAQHYSKVIERRASASTNKTRVRNHRYAALRALQKEGQYFSEEQMRQREPLLYEQYVGQYLTDEEVLERSQEAMKDSAQEASGSEPGGLAHLLLSSYQERLIQDRLQEEQEREDGAEEEDEDESEDDADSGVHQQEVEPTPEEKALLREEFISQMHQRFLEGKDKDFNYSEVDENPDYDNLDIVSRDAEDRYFDEDDEEDRYMEE
ncbi:uncharacterized protein V6R79_026147 [Siganus canaliculatus]